MSGDIIFILIILGYCLVYISFIIPAEIHDKKIWKSEHEVSTLSIDASMYLIFWPITAWFLIPRYFQNKEYYKYGIPYKDLF